MKNSAPTKKGALFFCIIMTMKGSAENRTAF